MRSHLPMALVAALCVVTTSCSSTTPPADGPPKSNPGGDLPEGVATDCRQVTPADLYRVAGTPLGTTALRDPTTGGSSCFTRTRRSMYGAEGVGLEFEEGSIDKEFAESKEELKQSNQPYQGTYEARRLAELGDSAFTNTDINDETGAIQGVVWSRGKVLVTLSWESQGVDRSTEDRLTELIAVARDLNKRWQG